MASMDSPSAERNKKPIWSALSTILPAKKEVSDNEEIPYSVLEIAAGCGVHTLYFTSEMIKKCISVSWYPTDPDQLSRASIEDRIRTESSEDVKSSIHPSLSLTLNKNGIVESEEDTGIPKEMRKKFDLITCINMIHISPWDASVGLMKVASEYLKSGGVLYCYGPYKVGGTAVQSNLNFDLALKARDPSWGVRNIEDITALAETNGFSLERVVDMPANNLSLFFRKT